MLDPKTGLVINEDTPELNMDVPSDTLPPVDRGDVTNLDEDHLRRYLASAMMNCLADKQDYGWLEKKNYSRRAYYGLKNEAMKHWPYEGSSNFPVPMTPTLVDTAWANIQAGLWAKENPVLIPGIGDEDIRPANILLKFMNWQVTQDMKFKQESDKNVLRTLLDGDGILKIMFDAETGKVKIFSIDIENFLVPIDSTGVQVDGSDIVIHLIPLSYNDIQIRKAMKIYRDPDAIVPGVGVNLRDSDQLRLTMDAVSGVSMDTKVRRESYYIAEFDVRYIPPNSYKPMYLKVWMSPNGGTIQRVRKVDKSIKRPYSKVSCYPFSDRFYSMGMPEKLQNIQEKLDYSDKQYTDALDIANSPAAFVDDTDSFNRARQKRVRGGIYPKGKGNTIDWEPQPPVERGFAQERAMLWEQGERLTGVIDITQGRSSSFGSKTLGEVEIRAARADIRFRNIFNRFGDQINDAVEIIYELDDMYYPPSKIMDVVGYSAEGYSVNEIFPKKDGVLVKHNFRFSGYLESDKNVEDDKKALFLRDQLVVPFVEKDPGNVWNISKELANINGVRNFASLVKRPPESRIIGVEEFIQRVISGEKNIQLRPGIDADEYIFEIELFTRSEQFGNLEDFQKKLIIDALRRSSMIAQAEMDQKMDLMAAMEELKMRSMEMNPAMGGQEQLGMGQEAVPEGIEAL